MNRIVLHTKLSILVLIYLQWVITPFRTNVRYVLDKPPATKNRCQYSYWPALQKGKPENRTIPGFREQISLWPHGQDTHLGSGPASASDYKDENCFIFWVFFYKPRSYSLWEIQWVVMLRFLWASQIIEKKIEYIFKNNLPTCFHQWWI